jgi:hypothetical protein
MKRDLPKAPTAVHGSLGITYHPNKKANVTVDALENEFTFDDLCDENHECRAKTRVQALLAFQVETKLGKYDLVTCIN